MTSSQLSARTMGLPRPAGRAVRQASGIATEMLLGNGQTLSAFYQTRPCYIIFVNHGIPNDLCDIYHGTFHFCYYYIALKLLLLSVVPITHLFVKPQHFPTA